MRDSIIIIILNIIELTQSEMRMFGGCRNPMFTLSEM